MNASLNHCHVLIVEDEFLLADMLAFYLQTEGCDVVGPVRSVEAGLRLLVEDAEIDCAVLDINLGHETSYALADVLLERHVPFLFVSGYDASVLPERYSGVTLKSKPVELLELTHVLEELVSGRRAAEATLEAHQVGSH